VVLTGVGYQLKADRETEARIKHVVADHMVVVNKTLEFQNEALRTNQEAIRIQLTDAQKFKDDVTNRLHNVDRKLDQLSWKLGFNPATEALKEGE
jgi:ABC-type transporter Mla subunit MlaD